MNKRFSSSETEREYKKAAKLFKKWLLPFDKRVSYKGLDNMILEGPNIITANHNCEGRDIAGLLNMYTRQLHFAASSFLFDKELFENKIKQSIGSFFHQVSKPVSRKFTNYIPELMKKYEMIPIDWQYKGDMKETVKLLQESIYFAKNLLINEEAIMIFQLDFNILKEAANMKNTDKKKSEDHPYLHKFNTTIAKIAYDIYRKESLDVPVTPIAIHGGEGYNPLLKTNFNVGKPMYISDYITGNDTIINFTNDLEKTVANLLVESGLPKSS